MLSLMVKLLPLAVVGLASPALISFCIVLLGSRQPLRTAIGFILGAVTVLLVLGTIVLILFNGTLSIPTPDIGRTLSVILGVLFVLLGIKYYLKVPDPDAPPPQWMERLTNITPLQAFLLGLLLIGTNLKVLAAYTFGLNEIIQAQIGLVAGLVALALMLVFVLSGLLAPIVVYVRNPVEADRLLGQFKAWVVDASRVVLALIFLGIGLYFAIKGLIGA
jgi:hypothetical protein